MTPGKAFCDRDLMADCFHALSQPLTSLRCAMEVALLEEKSADHYREVLGDSLALVERVAGLLGGIRNLWDSGEVSAPAGAVSLANCLEEIAADLLPVAEMAGKTVMVAVVPCQVHFDLQRLRQALLCLLECALGFCCPGSAITAQTGIRDGEARLRVSVAPTDVAGDKGNAPTDTQHKDLLLHRRLALAISRTIFEAGGGKFFMQQRNGGWRVEVRLPLALPEDQANFERRPGEGTSVRCQE